MITKYNILGLVFLADLIFGSICLYYSPDTGFGPEKASLFLPIAMVFALYMVWKDEDLKELPKY